MIDVSGGRRRRLVLALVGCLAAVSSGLVVEGASGANTAPVAIVIDSITGQDLDELGDLPTGAAPLTFVEVDQTFTVDVSFEDSAGAAVPFNSDTVLEITGTSNNGTVVLAPVAGDRAEGQRHVLPPDQHRASRRTRWCSPSSRSPSSSRRPWPPGVSYLPTAVPVKDLRFDVAQDARIADGVERLRAGHRRRCELRERHRGGARVRRS